jgi:hypothetical protein
VNHLEGTYDLIDNAQCSLCDHAAGKGGKSALLHAARVHQGSEPLALFIARYSRSAVIGNSRSLTPVAR